MSASAESKPSRFRRIESPTLEQFMEAAEVCYTRWPYLRETDTPARFQAFLKLKVELCVFTDTAGKMQCVGYLLPSSAEINGETLSWYFMFQISSRPDAPGAGSMLVRQIMQWYPAIFGVGITPDAEKLYHAFKWQPYPGFWRGVHPINLTRFVKDFGARIASDSRRRLLTSTAGIGNFFGSLIDAACSLGSTAPPWKPTEGKGALVAPYLGLYESGSVRAADVGGTGRILTLITQGSLRNHAAIWRSLRKQGARLCEVILYAEADRKRAMRLGYIPIVLQVWCWDKQGILARAIPVLQQRGFTFFDTDKVL